MGAHCWGSEESGEGPVRWTGLAWGFGAEIYARNVCTKLCARNVCVPGRAGVLLGGGCGCGVGLLFEIWIVDASIFQTRFLVDWGLIVCCACPL